MNPIVLLLVGSLLVKLLLGGLLPLSPDEAYYWVWSHHLQLSYYDHPPFVAWLYLLGQPFENLLSLVRWPGIVFGHLIFVIWYFILKDNVEPRRLFWILLVGLCSPLIGIGGMVITPDTPVLVFWSLALLCFLNAMRTERLIWYFAFGAACGLGFASKYHMVLMGPCVFLTLFFYRKEVRIRFAGLILFTLAFFALSSPVWIWNMQNDWISFRFQLNHGLGAKKYKFDWTIGYVAAQVLLLFPTLAWAALRLREKQWTWLYIFAWAPMIFFFMTSFKGRVEANWPIIAYPALLSLAVLQTQNLKSLKVPIAVWMTLLVLLIVDLRRPFIQLNLKTHDLVEFDDLTKVADQYRPLFARSYQMAAKLSFDSKQPVYKLNGLSRRDFFDVLPQSLPRENFFLAVETGENLPKRYIEDGWQVFTRHQVNKKFEVLEVRKQL